MRAYLSSVLSRLMSGLRTLTLVFVCTIVSAMMCCVSLFTGIIYMIYQYKTYGAITFDGILIFCSVVSLISLLMFLKLMCKKCWEKALRV